MLVDATPTKPVAPWIGGKSRIAKHIIERIRAIPHTCYAEPFIGMGGVFLRRPFAAKCEVINDYSGEVINLFRILQRHYKPFTDMLRYQLFSRAEYERLLSVPPDTLTDLERAARFLYIQRCSYGGRLTSRTFTTGRQNGSYFNVQRIIPLLEAVHSRLSRVTIENLHYAEFILRYDSKSTLFYLDPPYYGREGLYGKSLFSRDDFQKLADQLAGINGRFLLSLNDVPEVREVFKRFNFEQINVPYSLNKNDQIAAELLISN